MKKSFYGFILVCLLVLTASSCSETQPFTSNKRTNELLNIHSSTCPKIPFDLNTAKIIFFSDLHRGMGEKDVFKQNKELFRQILKHYFENGFTLVLIGDVEEGWGFQKDNTPLILDEHAKEFEIEKKFQDENRYYRIYGNHDDFFRGNLIHFGDQCLKRVYPAIIFSDKTNNFNMFVTHGCQGHGWHDAGDEVASWGVYVKYNWWLEIFPRKLKSEKQLIKKMEAIEKDFKHHEEMVYEWALNQKDDSGKKKYNILITGHTHIPVFNSYPTEHLYDVILEDIESGKYIFFNDIFEKKKTDDVSRTKKIGDSFKLPETLKNKMKQDIESRKNMTRKLEMLAARSPKDPFYFNTGCGFHSKIICIEISEGKIFLKLLGFDENGKIDFDKYVKCGELKDY
ncbi:MAG: metallophosphoesterase [Candidatus Aminicenantes bacterium]|nr:MAG: metallophosphoesterase [Candidatus Aminicenantes bacterium]